MIPTAEQQKWILRRARENLGNRIAYSTVKFLQECARLQSELAAQPPMQATGLRPDDSARGVQISGVTADGSEQLPPCA